MCHLLSAGFLRFKFNIREVSVRGEEPLVQIDADGADSVESCRLDHDPSVAAAEVEEDVAGFQFGDVEHSPDDLDRCWDPRGVVGVCSIHLQRSIP